MPKDQCFISSLPSFRNPMPDDLGFFFTGNQILTSVNRAVYTFPLSQIFLDLAGITVKNALFIEELTDKNLFAIELDPSKIPIKDPFRLTHGRDVLKTMNVASSDRLCRAKQLLYWHRSSLHCGFCGHPTSFSKREVAKECAECDRLIFPSTFPAVIVLIVKDDQILLARSPHFPDKMYSTIAGFVEAGETLEGTIHREVKEELGIQVHNISYFSSQSWPFPNSLMLGFQAEYKSGEITIDQQEIEDALWYSRSNLPLLPPKSSIARHLIDHHFGL